MQRKQNYQTENCIDLFTRGGKKKRCSKMWQIVARELIKGGFPSCLVGFRTERRILHGFSIKKGRGIILVQIYIFNVNLC
jgi:hypothetical protein